MQTTMTGGVYRVHIHHGTMIYYNKGIITFVISKEIASRNSTPAWLLSCKANIRPEESSSMPKISMKTSDTGSRIKLNTQVLHNFARKNKIKGTNGTVHCPSGNFPRLPLEFVNRRYSNLLHLPICPSMRAVFITWASYRP